MLISRSVYMFYPSTCILSRSGSCLSWLRHDRLPPGARPVDPGRAVRAANLWPPRPEPEYLADRTGLSRANCWGPGRRPAIPGGARGRPTRRRPRLGGVPKAGSACPHGGYVGRGRGGSFESWTALSGNGLASRVAVIAAVSGSPVDRHRIKGCMPAGYDRLCMVRDGLLVNRSG